MEVISKDSKDIGIIITSHQKPKFIGDALDSLFSQTFKDWEAVLFDSGKLIDENFFDKYKDSRLRIYRTEELPEFNKTITPSCYISNKAINEGIIKTKLLMYLCDDDVLLPRCFEHFVEVWNIIPFHAMYGSQDVEHIYPSGEIKYIKTRYAHEVKGKCVNGGKLDCVVDYLQVCHTMEILDHYKKIYKTDKYLSEDRKDNLHADGIFLEMLGAITPIIPIYHKVSKNRRTYQSCNTGYNS